MRRAAGLFDEILAWDNLREAFWKALRGKRGRADAQAFARDLDGNLRRLQDGLWRGTVRVGEYRQFTIFDPKERTITAPSFRERVLHHAVLNVCEPVFERFLIGDTVSS
jgi:hypothetical protein